ncbi:stage II sporulation protein E [Desulfofundulus sp. TPOSR]|uniref:stage II sporulation protein E n=1 Tax=Desulfofundulus sp. TPOSR TaxID=2714340 RepID=UPI00140B8365|nr:stage II sporulation protein E [Desulfofundulus sp. TPOSR]NHM26519.1 stage II sporulation protein E [Desulfofundulus sp. TPOSR]
MSDEINVYPYQRTGQGKERKRLPKKRKRWQFLCRPAGATFLTREGLLLFIAGFFLGRAVLLGEIVPCAAAFVAAATRTFPGSGLAALLGAGAGLATVSSGLSLAGALGTVVFTWLLVQAMPGGVKRPQLVVAAAVFSLTVVVKAGMLAFTGPSPYQYITIFFEGGFAALLTLVFLSGLPPLDKLTGLASLTGEELFSMLVLLAAVVAGTGDLQVAMFTLKGLLSRLIILLAALLGGVGLGAAVGAVVGVIPGLVYTAVPAMIGGYSFAGLLAGLCRGFGKPGVALGFLLSNIILSVYLADFGDLTAVMGETALAVLLFLLIPGRYIGSLSKSLFPVVLRVQGATPAADRVRAVVAGRMRNWSLVFDELSRSFNQSCATSPQEREEPSLQSLFNQIADKVCQGCGLYRTCWEWEFFRTYQSLLDLFTLVEIYGQVTGADLPDTLQRRCSRPKELAITVTCLYETYKLNRYWLKRLAESREIVSEQLKGVAQIIENLSSELEFEVRALTGDEQLLKQKLKQAGFPVAEVHVQRQGDGKTEVMITRSACGRQHECRDLAALVSRLMGESFALPFSQCPVFKPDPWCTFRLYSGLKFALNLGVAGIGKKGSSVSGDSYAFLPLREGKFALVLSDGMGSGAEAALESSTAVSLLGRLLETGLDRNLAVKTVNSIMILRSPGETFATLDMAMLDLYEGQADFVKIGAPPTFLIRNRRVSMIRASSLPVGIIRDIDVASVARTLLERDVLVMVSDGIIDSYRGSGDKEDWILGVLQEISDFSPQEMAELLLKLAQTGAGGEKQNADDMTVLVARVEKATPS